MKPVQSYSEFKSRLNEAREINEGLKDIMLGAIKKIGNFFKGLGSNFLNALVAQTKGDLPHNVKIKPCDVDIKILKEHGVKIKAPSETEFKLHESEVASTEGVLNEVKIYLQIAKKHNIRDYTNKTLMTEIRTAIEAINDGAITRKEKVQPALIWGAPGIGKTTILEALSDEIFRDKVRLIKVDLQTMNPEDFFLPYLKKGEEFNVKSARAPVDWLPVYNKNEGEKGNESANCKYKDVDGNEREGGIIFFDEIVRCKEATKNAMLGLLGPDRAIGNYILGDKWTILAAANRFEDEPDSNQNQEILNAFYNRFDHMNYAPKFEDWEKWATGKIDKNIVEFVRFFGKNDPDNDVYHGGGKYFYDLDTDRIANTTPRSWESASHALQNCKNSLKKMGTSLEDMSEEDFHETVVNALAKTVGEAAAIDFANFLSLMKHYSVEDANKVFTDPMKAITLRDIKQSVLENDESEVRNKQMTFMLVISMYKAGELLTKDEFTNLFKWMLRPENENDSVVMYFLTTLIKSHPYITTHRYSTAEIEELRKTDKDIDKKIELQQHFLTSPEFKQFSKMYYGVMGK